jgi:PEP-CTERM motif-containing protein
MAQAGGPSPSNAITAGQSFPSVSGFGIGFLSVALGQMGAGGTDGSFAYHTSVNLTLNAIGGPLLVGLLDNVSLGTGFDNATFKILSNGNILENHSFLDLASAQSFFSNNLLFLPILAGLNDIQMTFDAIMSGGQGFAFNYAAAGIAQTPLPASWTMMLIGLGALGLLGWRRKRKAQAA